MLSVVLLLMSFGAFAQDPWLVSADIRQGMDYYGESVSNGMIGMVSDVRPLRNSRVILGGAYDRTAKDNIDSYFDNIRFMDMTLKADGVSLDPGVLTGYRQTLDMRHACMVSQGTLRGKCRFTVRQYALRQLPFCVLTVVEIEPLRDVALMVASLHGVPGEMRDVRSGYKLMRKRRGNIYLMWTDARSASGSCDVSSASSFVFDGGARPEVSYDSVQHQCGFTVSLLRGENFRFALTGSLISSSHTTNPHNETSRLTQLTALSGTDNLVAAHCRAWDGLWSSDVLIDGDRQAQQDVHSMIYHLYSNVREGSRMSIPPMGLTGTTYYGHVFWDAEIWMMPALLLLHPELARSMIDYRIDRLDAARHNAFAHGYQGAMWPWESGGSGTEDTPTWTLTGTFEHHITGCVALAAWQYYCVTGDTLWLRSRAYPLISDCADFWTSRMETDSAGCPHIRNVVCADEYAANVDDNAFTNAIAMKTLDIALRAASVTGNRPHPLWAARAGRLPVYRSPDGITLEYQGYDGRKIKQADVNLLAYPLRVITDKQQILRDITYYAKRVPETSTPAMTESVFALLYARLGDRENAAKCFYQSYRPNQCPPFGVLAECKGGHNPYFLTGAGGTLQAVIMGFAGYDITEQGICRHPSALPKGWRGISVLLSRNTRAAGR